MFINKTKKLLFRFLFYFISSCLFNFTKLAQINFSRFLEWPILRFYSTAKELYTRSISAHPHRSSTLPAPKNPTNGLSTARATPPSSTSAAKSSSTRPKTTSTTQPTSYRPSYSYRCSKPACIPSKTTPSTYSSTSGPTNR